MKIKIVKTRIDSLTVPRCCQHSILDLPKKTAVEPGTIVECSRCGDGALLNDDYIWEGAYLTLGKGWRSEQ